MVTNYHHHHDNPINETTTTEITAISPSIHRLEVFSSTTLLHESAQFKQLGCLKHEPITVEAKDVGPNGTINMTLEMKMRDGCGPLRRDWRNNPPLSPLGQRIVQQQSNCSLPVLSWIMDWFQSGIGAHVSHWSQIMCYAWDHHMRLQSYEPTWLWLDQTHCPMDPANRSPWLCYFPKMEQLCNESSQQQPSPPAVQNNTPSRPIPKIRAPKMCRKNKLIGFPQPFRAATVEYIFRSVSPLVIQEAQRQVGVVFGPNGAPHDLITVHVRWGDKDQEMKLVAIDKYISAVWKLLLHEKNDDELIGGPRRRRRSGDNNKTDEPSSSTVANIYLATEDPVAAEAFIEAAPKHWNVFIDVAVEELTPFRPPSSRLDCASFMARNTRGRGGLVHMGSLLVSMEANDFVLSTASTFGRVMNGIRTNILDPRCGNCTRMIDLHPGVWS
jgi:hypothetical protein